MDQERYQGGLQVRREVLGDEYVDRATKNVDEFNDQFQKLVSEFCWGEVWTDETLSRRERSLVNLGMIAAARTYARVRDSFPWSAAQRSDPRGATRGVDPDRGLRRYSSWCRLLSYRT